MPQLAPNGIDIVSFDYIPPADLVGTDSFLYVVTDKGTPRRSGTGTIMISIEGINDAPVFQRGVDIIAPEDSDTVTINNWATGIFAGPPAAIDELSSQTVSFEVNATNAGLFADAPTITPEEPCRSVRPRMRMVFRLFAWLRSIAVRGLPRT